MRIVNSACRNLIFGESLLVLYLETFHIILLFKTLPTYHVEQAFPGLFAGIAPFLPTLSRSECIQCNLEDTHGSRIAIDRFHWPHLGHCLLEVYPAPHSLYSPFASHALLAIK
jgi:hypothetical protein